ncbi:MAG: EamA family transporter [Chloroflexota bacterium]|nr:EamA family transporter [Chloroflexota bacterium]
MGVVAISLVLVSAVMHATWNVLAKRSADPLAFLFTISSLGLVMYAAPVAIVVARDGISSRVVPFLLVSGTLEMLYTVLLAAAYRNGALSLTYPIARGTGVVLVPLLAIPLLNERPTAIALAGIATILFGFVTISVLGARNQVTAEIASGRRDIIFALLTGLTIASYSLIDKAGIKYANPLVYVYGLIGLQSLLLLPYIVARRRDAVAAAWRTSRSAILAGGVLHIGTYLIVLAAMKVSGSKVGYIVPLRETSIVFATLLGVLILKERIGRVRIAGSALIAIGVLAIALGG